MAQGVCPTPFPNRSIEIESLLAVARPRFGNVEATEQIVFDATLTNLSNVPVDVTLGFTWRDPVGGEIVSGEQAVSLAPDEIVKTVSLDELTFTFPESGEYPLAVEMLSGPTPATVQGDVIAIAPAIRIEPSQSLVPATVLPDADKRLRINIRIEGEEQ